MHPRRRTLALASLAAVVTLSSCTSTSHREGGGPQARLIYPPAPATPVIEWVTTVARAGDVGAGESAWIRALVGDSTRSEPRLIAPTAVAIGPDGTLFVVDQQLDGLVLINRAQRRFDLFRGDGPGRLRQPVGVAVADDGTLFVTDVAADAVYVFGPDLRYLRALGGPGVFVRPTNLALSADGRRLAVCDTTGQRVLVLDTRSGATELTLGSGQRSSSEGEFNTPYAVAFDSEGYLFVTDYLNFRVQVFAPSGTFDFAFGQAGDRAGDLNRPRGLAVDAASGVIYVVDGAFQLIQMFNLDGELLMWFGGPGAGPGSFSLPTAIARRGDLLAVADTMNGRIQMFRFLGVPAS